MDQGIEILQEPLSILMFRQSVVEYSANFVRPDLHEHVFVLAIVVFNLQHALEDLGYVSQVKGVMALCGGREKFGGHLLIDIDAHFDDGVNTDQ